jgi:hypothetical protein
MALEHMFAGLADLCFSSRETSGIGPWPGVRTLAGVGTLAQNSSKDLTPKAQPPILSQD